MPHQPRPIEAVMQNWVLEEDEPQPNKSPAYTPSPENAEWYASLRYATVEGTGRLVVREVLPENPSANTQTS